MLIYELVRFLQQLTLHFEELDLTNLLSFQHHIQVFQDSLLPVRLKAVVLSG